MNMWLKKDLRYIWHPFTQMKDCEKLPPILIKRSKGTELYDQNGKIYYDTISSWWCNVHGHNHPQIIAAIKRQLKSLDHVLFAGFTHQPAITLAEKLLLLVPPNLKRVFYSDNGSTSVEVALKMSFQYWQNTGQQEKKEFIHLDYGYHGDTIGAMSVSGESVFNARFRRLCFHSYSVAAPYCYRCPMEKKRTECGVECVKPLETLLKNKCHKIAGLILEPLVLAAGGMIIYPAQYLKKAAGLAKKYNVHLILDEVATGFGRTGKMFALEHAQVNPDFLCLSKGITSGTLPLAATLTTNRIYQAFYADYAKLKTFFHGHTYTANPIACAAANASLEIFKTENTLAKVRSLMPDFHQRLEEFRNLPIVGDVRYLGLIGALELVKNKKTKQPFSFQERIGFKIYQQGLKHGLILRPLGNVIYFYLPLCVKKDELRTILDKTSEIILSLRLNKD